MTTHSSFPLPFHSARKVFSASVGGMPFRARASIAFLLLSRSAFARL